MDKTLRSAVMIEIRQLYEALQRFDLLACRMLGLNLTDLRCVNILRDGPLSAGQIAFRVGMTSGSVTAMLDRLEARNVIARERLKSDRRGVSVTLDPEFRERIAMVYSQLGHAIEQGLEQSGFERSAETARLLGALVAGVRAADAVLQEAISEEETATRARKADAA